MRIPKLFEHTFPMCCVLIFLMGLIALGAGISARHIINEQNSDIYIKYGVFKDDYKNYKF